MLMTIKISMTDICTPATEVRNLSATLDDANSKKRASAPSSLRNISDATRISRVSSPCVMPGIVNCICSEFDLSRSSTIASTTLSSCEKMTEACANAVEFGALARETFDALGLDYLHDL